MTFGKSGRAYIIAEAGVNHNGSLDLARRLVISAKEAGADAVKFQTFKAERVAQASAPKADYQLRNTDRGESQIEMLRKLELPDSAHAELIALCRELGIEFLSTPYNEEDIDFLHGLGVRAFKLASIHCVEPHILRYAARTGRHLIVSTGMATIGELDELVEALHAAERLLPEGGRLVVVTFHSLEDRIVKRYLRGEAHPEADIPSRLPIRAAELPRGRIRVIGKPVRAGVGEVRANPRARSAVMRIAETLA